MDGVVDVSIANDEQLEGKLGVCCISWECNTNFVDFRYSICINLLCKCVLVSLQLPKKNTLVYHLRLHIPREVFFGDGEVSLYQKVRLTYLWTWWFCCLEGIQKLGNWIRKFLPRLDDLNAQDQTTRAHIELFHWFHMCHVLLQNAFVFDVSFKITSKNQKDSFLFHVKKLRNL